MKKILFAIAFVVSATTAFVACSGSDEPNDTPNLEVSSITLTVDKNSIEADGVDAAKFKVTTDKGVDITGMDGVRILIPDPETFLEGMEYTSTVNETVVFKARYSGKLSNEVTVEVKNRAKYEKYFRKVLIAQYTGTWCVNCPNMTNAIKAVSTQMPDRFEVVAFHGDQGTQNTDPYTTEYTAQLGKQFELSGYPGAVIDMRQKASGASSNLLMLEVKKSLRDYPATCGVKITTDYNEDTKICDATVTVNAVKANKYSLGCAVVVDGLVAPQEGATSDYVHNNVLLSVNNINGEFIGSGQIKENEELSHTFNFDLSKTKYKIEDMRIVAFVLAESDGAFYVNNTTSCKLAGGSVDYKLN